MTIGARCGSCNRELLLVEPLGYLPPSAAHDGDGKGAEQEDLGGLGVRRPG